MNIRLKKAREKCGLSQAEVAKKAEITERGYQRYEAGERVPNVLIAKRIACILNCTVDDLF